MWCLKYWIVVCFVVFVCGTVRAQGKDVEELKANAKKWIEDSKAASQEDFTTSKNAFDALSQEMKTAVDVVSQKKETAFDAVLQEREELAEKRKEESVETLPSYMVPLLTLPSPTVQETANSERFIDNTLGSCIGEVRFFDNGPCCNPLPQGVWVPMEVGLCCTRDLFVDCVDGKCACLPLEQTSFFYEQPVFADGYEPAWFTEDTTWGDILASDCPFPSPRGQVVLQRPGLCCYENDDLVCRLDENGRDLGQCPSFPFCSRDLEAGIWGPIHCECRARLMSVFRPFG